MERSMTESAILLNAQLGFLDTPLAVIHIPLHAYPLFIQPIVQLLLQNSALDKSGNVVPPSRPWAYWHPFVNISITLDECSIVCPRQDAERLFAPIRDRLDPADARFVSISSEDFSVIVIGGEGLEAGQRVLDLTSPLAMAGISIFFITSYYSDFIIVPRKARSKVIRALEDRGFVFEADAANGEAGHMTNPASPLLHTHHHKHSSGSSFEFPPTASTPPPANVPELQIRTFKQLKRNNIAPRVDSEIELVTCAVVKDSTIRASIANFTEGKLHLGLVRCLTTMPPPRFLSLTLTDTDSASITLEKGLLTNFHNNGEDLLLGKDGMEQVPITFDLRQLPLESTGIVCGVASRLIDGMRGRIGREGFNMSYLSTARAGHVIVYQEELEDAMECLHGAQQNRFGGVITV